MAPLSRSIIPIIPIIPIIRTTPVDRRVVEETLVEFDCKVQTLRALQAAAYRLVGTASCEITKIDERWVCRLVANGTKHPFSAAQDLRGRLIDLVTDENLRESIASKTEPTRNLILALAFGHLAGSAKPNSR